MASKTLNLALLPVGGRRLVRALALLFMLAALALAADSTWTQQQELTASNAMFNDQFGRAVSVSGNTAVIGADGKNGSQGAAYVIGEPSMPAEMGRLVRSDSPTLRTTPRRP
ncbi:MAG: FG-GAP repeat protein [Bryobacteraceae bacterium]